MINSQEYVLNWKPIIEGKCWNSASLDSIFKGYRHPLLFCGYPCLFFFLLFLLAFYIFFLHVPLLIRVEVCYKSNICVRIDVELSQQVCQKQNSSLGADWVPLPSLCYICCVNELCGPVLHIGTVGSEIPCTWNGLLWQGTLADWSPILWTSSSISMHLQKGEENYLNSLLEVKNKF